jgi:hypothetical protein
MKSIASEYVQASRRCVEDDNWNCFEPEVRFDMCQNVATIDLGNVWIEQDKIGARRIDMVASALQEVHGI